MKSYLMLLLCCLLGGYPYCQAQTTQADSATTKPKPGVRFRMYPLAILNRNLGLGLEFRLSSKHSFVLDGFYKGSGDKWFDPVEYIKPGGEFRADYRIYRDEESKRRRFFIGPGIDYRQQQFTEYDSPSLLEFFFATTPLETKKYQKIGKWFGFHVKAGYEYRFRHNGKLLLEGYATGGLQYQTITDITDTTLGKYQPFDEDSLTPRISFGIALKF